MKPRCRDKHVFLWWDDCGGDMPVGRELRVKRAVSTLYHAISFQFLGNVFSLRLLIGCLTFLQDPYGFMSGAAFGDCMHGCLLAR